MGRDTIGSNGQARTRELQSFWHEWLSTSEQLLRALHEQTAALTLKDATRISRIEPELGRLVQQMKSIDDNASSCARELAFALDTEPSLRGLVRSLAKSEAQQLQALANRVMVAARNVHAVMEKNRALMRDELSSVGGTLTLIARAAGENPNSYRKRKSGRAAVLLDEAA